MCDYGQGHAEMPLNMLYVYKCLICMRFLVLVKIG